MRADLLRWILFFLFTGTNAKEETVSCEWVWEGPLLHLLVTVPERSDYYHNPTGVTELLKLLDRGVFQVNASAYRLDNLNLDAMKLHSMWSSVDVMPCKRSEFEFIVRVDL